MTAEILAHGAGDYLIQTDWMASEKLRRWDAAAVHAVTYAACFLPITRNWKALAVIGGTHMVLDRFRIAKHIAWAKNQLAPRKYRFAPTSTGYSADKPEYLSFWLMIITDNVMHMLINRLALRRWNNG